MMTGAEAAPRYQQRRTSDIASGQGTSKAALPDLKVARSRFRPGMRAGGTCTQPRRLQQRLSWTQAAATLHQRGARVRCGHGCERGDGGGTTRSIAHMDDLATIQGPVGD